MLTRLIRRLTFSSEPPVITPSSIKNSYNEGTKVDVTCNATGKPTPTVTWFREGSSKVYSTGEGSIVLSFSSVSRSDAGQYRCKANNTAGTDETRALSLVLHCKYSSKQYCWDRRDCSTITGCTL